MSNLKPKFMIGEYYGETGCRDGRGTDTQGGDGKWTKSGKGGHVMVDVFRIQMG